jgi:hypothetical protein
VAFVWANQLTSNRSHSSPLDPIPHGTRLRDFNLFRRKEKAAVEDFIKTIGIRDNKLTFSQHALEII